MDPGSRQPLMARELSDLHFQNDRSACSSVGCRWPSAGTAVEAIAVVQAGKHKGLTEDSH